MSLTNAGDQILGFANKLKDLVGAAEEIKKAGGLEQLVKELDGRRSIAEAGLVKAVAQLDLAQKAVSDAQSKADEISGKALADASEIVRKAKDESDIIKSEAKIAVGKMVAESNKTEMSLAASISEKRATISVLDKEIKDLDSTLKLLLAEKKALLAKLG